MSVTAAAHGRHAGLLWIRSIRHHLLRTHSWIVLLGREGVINDIPMRLGIIDEPLSLLYRELGVKIGTINILAPFFMMTMVAAMSRRSSTKFPAWWRPPSFDVAPEQVIEHGRSRLAPYKYPREVCPVAELPRGATGKIHKELLVMKALDAAGEQACGP